MSTSTRKPSPARLTQPLKGVRVIEVCDIWVGPGVGTMLAELGADVIKLESIQRRTISRGLAAPVQPNPLYPDSVPGDRPWNRNCHFNYHNHDKFGITLDLSRPKGVQVYLELIKTCDVVIENFYSTMMDKLGIHYESLKAVRPDLIMLSMPPYGSTGPYRDHVTYGWLIDSVCGHASLRGYPGTDLGDTQAAFLQDPAGISMGAFAVITALHNRARTGKGQHVEMAQMEAFIPRIGEYLLDYSMNGRAARRVGNRHPSMAPHGAYRCRGNDRWITIAVASDDEWRALCGAIGHPELAERYTDPTVRWQRQQEIDPLIANWTAERTDYEAMHTLQHAGVAAGVVMDIAQLYDDPQMAHRGVFQELTHADAGAHRYYGAPWKLSKSDCRIRRPANLLGEDNGYVYGEVLGFSTETMKQLEEEAYIGDTPLDAH